MSEAAVQVWSVGGFAMRAGTFVKFALPVEAYDEADAMRAICTHFGKTEIRIVHAHRCLIFERELARWSTAIFAEHMGPF